PLDRIPIYVRAGGLLPLAPVRNSTREPAGDTVALHLWPGPEGSLLWYEDDGVSLDHGTGAFHRRLITQERRGRTTRVGFGPAEGRFPSRLRAWRLVFWHLPATARVRIAGVLQESPGSPGVADGLLVVDVPQRADAFEVRVVGGSV
ncbi:MAG: DUF5110 domain-containing protein, partial [Verrucomicrobiota bacterium]